MPDGNSASVQKASAGPSAGPLSKAPGTFGGQRQKVERGQRHPVIMAGMPYGLQAMLKVRPLAQIAAPSRRCPPRRENGVAGGSPFDPAPTPPERIPWTHGAVPALHELPGAIDTIVAAIIDRRIGIWGSRRSRSRSRASRVGPDLNRDLLRHPASENQSLTSTPVPFPTTQDGHKHMSGLDEAVIKNVEACKQLSKITRTSLGPNGACASPQIFKKNKTPPPTGGQLFPADPPRSDPTRTFPRAHLTTCPFPRVHRQA